LIVMGRLGSPTALTVHPVTSNKAIKTLIIFFDFFMTSSPQSCP